jgi:protoheme ferro-lyase
MLADGWKAFNAIGTHSYNFALENLSFRSNFDLTVVYSLALLYIQAEELRKFLWAKNVPAKVYVGMRYWHPFTEEAIEQVSGGL